MDDTTLLRILAPDIPTTVANEIERDINITIEATLPRYLPSTMPGRHVVVKHLREAMMKSAAFGWKAANVHTTGQTAKPRIPDDAPPRVQLAGKAQDAIGLLLEVLWHTGQGSRTDDHRATQDAIDKATALRDHLLNA